MKLISHNYLRWEHLVESSSGSTTLDVAVIYVVRISIGKNFAATPQSLPFDGSFHYGFRSRRTGTQAYSFSQREDNQLPSPWAVRANF